MTSVASLTWLPVYDEWDGDVYLGPEGKSESEKSEDAFETGQVVFKGDTLPWQVGTYEVSYL